MNYTLFIYFIYLLDLFNLP